MNDTIVRLKNIHAKYKHYLFKRIALDEKQRTKSTLSFNHNYKRYKNETILRCIM